MHEQGALANARMICRRKGSKIEPESNRDDSETAQIRLGERIRNAQDNSHRFIWWSLSTMVGLMPSPYSVV